MVLRLGAALVVVALIALVAYAYVVTDKAQRECIAAGHEWVFDHFQPGAKGTLIPIYRCED